MSNKFYELAVVIPAYNESECIQNVIREWSHCFHKLKLTHKFFVINDGSTDNTEEVLINLKNEIPELEVLTQKNQGHGKSLFHGYQRALQDSPQFVFQTDSDNQFSPDDFPKFWVERYKSPFILGHRYKRNDPIVRKIISTILSHMIFKYFDAEVEDANCPYRLMESSYLQSMLTVIPKDIFAPNVFLSILAATEKQCLKEIIVEHKERKTGTNSILRWSLVKACWKSLRDFFKFKFTLNDRKKILRDIRETDQKLKAA